MKKLLIPIILLFCSTVKAQTPDTIKIKFPVVNIAGKVDTSALTAKLAAKVDTSYRDTLHVDKYLNYDSAKKTLHANVSNDPDSPGDSAKLGTDWMIKQLFRAASDSSFYVTPNVFAHQGFNDVEKINKALDLAILLNKTLMIGYNIERGSSLWLLDSAILLKSHSDIVIQNAKIKQSDSCRDNIFRTANAGLGITNTLENPFVSISIRGVGNATLEGADNPRATGDLGKALSLTPSLVLNNSYGTDVGKAGRNQTGDWRNIGILIANTNTVSIEGIYMHNIAMWGISFERSSDIHVKNIQFDSPAKRLINGDSTYVKNADGINFRMGCNNFTVDNINGITGDDGIACSLFPGTISTSGDLGSGEVSGNTYDSLRDDIYNGNISNISLSTYYNMVRVSNVRGSVIKNISIHNILDISDTSTFYRAPFGGAVLFGDNNPTYGGSTRLGECSNVTVDNVKSFNNLYAVRILGSLSESSITNVWKFEKNAYPPIYFDPTSSGARNLYTANIYDVYNGITDLSTMRSGTSGYQKTGIFSDSSSNLTVIDSAHNAGLKYAVNYAANYTARSIPDKNYVDSLTAAAIAASGSGTVTTFSKTDGYGIISTVTNPTSTPNYSAKVDTSVIASKGFLSNYLPKADSTIANRVTNVENTLSNTQDFDPSTKADVTKVQSDSSVLQSAIALKANIASPTFTTQIISPIVYGSSASGGTLSLFSTSNATKGKILFGSLNAFDEVNNRWGFGTVTPGAKVDVVGDLWVHSGSLYTNNLADYNGSGFVISTGNPASVAFTIKNTNASPTANLLELRNNTTLQASVGPTGIGTFSQYRLSALNTAPTSSTDTGTPYEIRITAGYIYVCIATNTWVRAALTTW